MSFLLSFRPDTGSAIPDSVVNQYPASTFSESTWEDDVGSADMSVTGLTASTFSNGEDSVFGNGTDVHGLADTIELGTSLTYGLALTVQTTDAGVLLGEVESNFNEFVQVRTNRNKPKLTWTWLEGGGGITDVDTTTDVADGTPHAVVINKTGDSASDIDMWVDDMADSDEEANVISSGSNNSSSYGGGRDMGFYGRNVAGSVDNLIAADVGIFEFNSEPYSESERQGILDRRPEV